MTRESDVQRSLAGFLRERGDLTKNLAARAFAERELGGNARLSPVEQLEIYREQFWLRHTSSLCEDFPGIGGVLGQTTWNRLIEGYLELEVPHDPNLRDLGRQLPAYVESQTWLPHHRLVCDMARLEWALIEVFDAAGASPLSPEKLAAVPEDAWERARLVASPTLRLPVFDYPVLELRRGLVKASGVGPIPLPEPERVHLALHRPELVTRQARLEPLAHALLSKLASGVALGEACELTAREAAVPVELLGGKLESWFGAWAREGYLVDVVLD